MMLNKLFRGCQRSSWFSRVIRIFWISFLQRKANLRKNTLPNPSSAILQKSTPTLVNLDKKSSKHSKEAKNSL